MQNNRLLDIFLIVVVLLVGTFAAVDVVRRLVGMFNPNTTNSQTVQQAGVPQVNRATTSSINTVNNRNTQQSNTPSNVNTNNTRCFNDNTLSIREADSLYHRYIVYILRLNFKNPESYQKNNAVVDILVNPSGNIISYTVREHSCSNNYLNSIIKALEQSSPVQPFLTVMGNENRAYELRFNGSELYAHRGDIYTHWTNNLPIKNIETKSCCITHAKETNINHSLKTVDSLGDTCNSKDIQANWNPILTRNNTAHITFDVYKDGKTNITEVSSDNADAKQAAINAIKHTKCQPFPKEFNKNVISVKYSFYVNDIHQY